MSPELKTVSSIQQPVSIMKNHIDLKMPTEWNQLTRRQLLYVCRLFLIKLTEFEFKLRIFIRFTGITALPIRKVAGQVFYAFKKSGQVFWISIPEIYSFIGSAGFLMSDSHLTKNIFPRIRLLWKRFYGPSNSCYNITMLEYLHAEATLHRFMLTRNITHLRTLCAVLYRPQVKNYNPNSPAFNGDRREAFNDFNYQQRAKWFNFLSPRKVYAVYMFYAGCRNSLAEKYPAVFKGETKVSSEMVNPVDSIRGLILSLTNSDVTKIGLIENTLLWDAVAHLDSLISANKDAMKQLRKNSKR